MVQVKLLPTPAQSDSLTETLTVCNDAANHVAQVAHERGIVRHWDLRAVTYGGVRERGLGAQPAQHVIKKVADAYTTRRANIRAGSYGPAGSVRRTRIEASPVRFRATSAQPFDDRCLSWNHDQRTVSIWTVHGRVKVAFTDSPERLKFLAQYRRGETDLIRRRDGSWFLSATCDLPDVEPAPPTGGFIGVDMGIVTIASTATVDADGSNPQPGPDWSGGAVTLRRRKNVTLRARLQRKNTQSAKRLLRNRSRKETRFVTDVNHQISKTIVAEAERTGRGIAVEDLTGILDRVRHRKPQRATMNSWAFAQLGQFLTYKAARAGVFLTQVDPRHTSQTCHACGYVSKQNRPTQAEFTCRGCSVSLNADLNAAINIATRGVRWWGEVNRPNAA